MYKMGKNAIEAGSRDTWTIYPKRIEAVRSRGRCGSAAQGDAAVRPWRCTPACCRIRRCAIRAGSCFRRISRISSPRRSSSTPSSRPASSCIARRRRSRLAGKAYPAGSYVVKTAQAFRAHVHGHVRAAGSSERLPVSGRASEGAVRRDRLQPVVLDGCELRPDPRGLRWPVRDAARHRLAAAGTGRVGAGGRRLPDWRRDQRRVRRRQSAAEGERRSLPAHGTARSSCPPSPSVAANPAAPGHRERLERRAAPPRLRPATPPG